MSDLEDDPVAQAAARVALSIGVLLVKLLPVVKNKVPGFKPTKHYEFDDCCKAILRKPDVFFPDPEVRKAAKVHVQRASLIPERVSCLVGPFYCLSAKIFNWGSFR